MLFLMGQSEPTRRTALFGSLAMIRPMSEAPKVDGHEVLAWQTSEWGFPPRWRVIHWSEGPHHVCYDKCWVCSVCTISIPERQFAGWVDMPPNPGSTEQPAPSPTTLRAQLLRLASDLDAIGDLPASRRGEEACRVATRLRNFVAESTEGEMA